MKKFQIKTVAAIMFLAVAGALILQASWLKNSYSISKTKADQDIKTILDDAIAEQKRQVADTVRSLLKQVVKSNSDFEYKIFYFKTGTSIGFKNKKHLSAYATYLLSADEVKDVEKDPYSFLIKKINTLNLDDLEPIYSVTAGQTNYEKNSVEDKIAHKLMRCFYFYEDTATLLRIIKQNFADRNIRFKGSMREFKDLSDIYEKKTPANYNLNSPDSNLTVSIVMGSQGRKPLAVKLDLLSVYIDNLNVKEDTTYIARPLLYDINAIMMDKIPVILLSVKTPSSFVISKMVTSIIGSTILLLFIGCCLAYMFYILLKQKKLAEIKNDFVSNISHELKTPIATAQAAVQGLQYFDVLKNSDKTKLYLNTAATEIQRLSSMVNKILNISVYESDDFKLDLTVFNLKEILDQIIIAQQIRNEKSITINLNYHAQQQVFADKNHIYNIIANLIDNAIKYSGNEVVIDIECIDTNDGISISISDNGTGIEKQFQKHIFDKFFRVPNPNSHAVKGYGLGLNYVKLITEKHKGTVALKSSDANGSTFVINLPKKQ